MVPLLLCLLVLCGVDARPSSCQQYCESTKSKSWPVPGCKCNAMDRTKSIRLPREDQLEPSSIYYTPAEPERPPPALPAAAPLPFYIVNPGRRAVYRGRLNDVAVKRIVKPTPKHHIKFLNNGSMKYSNPIILKKDNYDTNIAENNRLECLDLHILVLARKDSSNNAAKLVTEERLRKYEDMSDSDIIMAIQTKCNQPIETVGENLRNFDKVNPEKLDNVFNGPGNMLSLNNEHVEAVTDITSIQNKNETQTDIMSEPASAHSLETISEITNIPIEYKTQTEEIAHHNNVNSHESIFTTPSLIESNNNQSQSTTEMQPVEKVQTNYIIEDEEYKLNRTFSTLNYNYVVTETEKPLEMLSFTKPPSSQFQESGLHDIATEPAMYDENKDHLLPDGPDPDPKSIIDAINQTTETNFNQQQYNVTEITRRSGARELLKESDVKIPKMISKELVNGSFVSDVLGYEDLANGDFESDTKNSLEGDESEARNISTSLSRRSEVLLHEDINNDTKADLIDVKYNDLGNEDMQADLEGAASEVSVNFAAPSEAPRQSEIVGKLYFMSSDQLIPARFVQNPEGEIVLGLDGPALCDKIILNNKNKSVMFSKLCSFINTPNF
ncbi:hypothetical protein JYU34_000061 [Plutella xylostella]|uniref:Uncharacterized protein n=1 Tax=Plutella xylostella TaxID=51655 RepID=A0ABQ7R6R3_PLUXY|nr:hypothetical protein JYU34_000061 [Plutella xylostella]